MIEAKPWKIYIVGSRSEAFRRDLLLSEGWNFRPPISKTDSKNGICINGTYATVFTHYRSVRVSLVCLKDGCPQLIVDQRNGYHSELLRSEWTGFTIFYRRV